jgi:hypothetical protein
VAEIELVVSCFVLPNSLLYVYTSILEENAAFILIVHPEDGSTVTVKCL